MRRQLILMLGIMFCAYSLFAQSDKLSNYRDSLIWYGDIMHNASVLKNRNIAEKELSTLIERVLNEDRDFKESFSGIPGFRFLYSPDSTFRIASWQLVDSLEHGNFNAVFQIKGEQPIALQDVSENVGNPGNGKYRRGRWIGVVYSDIISYGPVTDSSYILIGSGIIDKLHWKHIAESMKIVEGKPVFGNNGFSKKQKSFDREILEFSAGSGVSMHYFPNKKLIVFDDLQLVVDPISGRHGYVPSGFYNAYRMTENGWIYEEDVELFND